MSKMGTRCYCVKQKGHKSQHSNQPFLTHFQRSDLQRCLVGEIHEFHGWNISAHPWVSWETKPVRHSAQLRGASNRSEGPAHAAGWGLAAKFQYPVPFSWWHFCAFRWEMHSELEEVRCSESAVHRAKGFYVTYRKTLCQGQVAQLQHQRQGKSNFFCDVHTSQSL